ATTEGAGSAGSRAPTGNATTRCCRMATMERTRCWFNPMRPVTPFIMMPMRRLAISPSLGAHVGAQHAAPLHDGGQGMGYAAGTRRRSRSEEHTSELQSRVDLVCRLLLEKKKRNKK